MLLLLLCVLPARGAEGAGSPGESAILGRRLEEVAQKEKEARGGKEALWVEVLDELHALLGMADELAPVEKDHVLQVRRACQARLARLPPALLARHRQR